VIGMPDNARRERICAYIKLKTGSTASFDDVILCQGVECFCPATAGKGSNLFENYPDNQGGQAGQKRACAKTIRNALSIPIIVLNVSCECAAANPGSLFCLPGVVSGGCCIRLLESEPYAISPVLQTPVGASRIFSCPIWLSDRR